MSEPYTPTTDEVRGCYLAWRIRMGAEDEFDRWLAPYKEALDVVQRVQWLGDILNGHDRWLAAHDKKVLDKAVQRADRLLGMWVRCGSFDPISAEHIVAAIRGEGDQA